MTSFYFLEIWLDSSTSRHVLAKLGTLGQSAWVCGFEPLETGSLSIGTSWWVGTLSSQSNFNVTEVEGF